MRVSSALEVARIIAQARVVFEVAEVKRGAAPFTTRVYVFGARACAAELLAGGLEAESVMPLAQVIDRLAARLAGPAVPAVSLLPSEIRVIAWLWPEQKKSLAVAQSPDACVEGLVNAGLSSTEAQAVIATLQQTSALVSSSRGLTVSKPLVPVLESFWSGQLLELKIGTVDRSRSSTLLYVGADRHRFQMERVAATSWQRHAKLRNVSDEELLVFQSQPRAAIKASLGPLLAGL
jgi:hypothetical protein